MTMTVLYEVYNGLYANLTNRCSCACTFCVRQSKEGVHESDSLWLDYEPSITEVVGMFGDFDMKKYDELVFCGYGEPTERFDDLIEIARYAKRRFGLRVRINTNGQGNLINDRNIAPEMAGIIDSLSISLNAPNAKRYQEVTQSKFGEAAFDAMIAFTKEAARYVPEIVMTTVDTTISHEDEEACRKICEDLGVRYRIRAFG